MAKQTKSPELIRTTQDRTFIPGSGVNPDFQRIGEEILQRHLKAFKRLADR